MARRRKPGNRDARPAAVDSRTAYGDIPGSCEAASPDGIRKHGFGGSADG